MLETLNEWGYALQQTLQGQLESGSVLAIFIVFAAGVLTSFTPCVYPMIPVTVTYMGSAAAGDRSLAVRLSVTYVLGMAIVYAALGVAASVLGETFGQYTRTPWVFAAVGILIAVFGAAMLDWINIPVPGMMAKVQSQGRSKGGYLGAVLMGMAAGFVAAPCTAPVLGLLLIWIARSGNVVWGGVLMMAFALGLGLLLMVVGIFSGLLTSLPKAGAWMSRIKLVFGIGMFLIAAYFLYQAAGMWLGGS